MTAFSEPQSPIPPNPRTAGEADLGPLKNYIAFQLRRAQDVSFQAFARRVGESDLSPGHFAILAVIAENPGLNQTSLSQATGRDKSTLTPALKGLEKHGLISRTRSEVDRRSYHLHLTEAGHKHLARLMTHAEAHDRKLDEIVGEFHKPLLIHLLERIVAELEEADQGE
jgi:DNA-binding MarR family transcriptional regulator